MMGVRCCLLTSALLPPERQNYSVVCITTDFKKYFLADSFYEGRVIFPTSLGRSAMQKLGTAVFEEVYNYLRRARHQKACEAEIREHLETVVPRASDCFEVDQLLYFEEQLLTTEGKEPTLQSHHCEAAAEEAHTFL